MKGKKRKRGMTDNFLVSQGCAPEGSTIEMTENAFMTTEAWETITPKVSTIYPCTVLSIVSLLTLCHLLL